MNKIAIWDVCAIGFVVGVLLAIYYTDLVYSRVGFVFLFGVWFLVFVMMRRGDDEKQKING